MTANQISYAKLKEDERNHRALEQIQFSTQREQVRANRATEQLKSRQLQIDDAYKQGSLSLSQSQLAESIRHNQATEKNALLLGYANVSQVERNSLRSAALERARISATERIANEQRLEQIRSNQAQERLKAAALEEQQRHSLQTEMLTARQADMQERIAHANRRSNEAIAQRQQMTSLYSAGMSSVSRFAATLLGGALRGAR